MRRAAARVAVASRYHGYPIKLPLKPLGTPYHYGIIGLWDDIYWDPIMTRGVCLPDNQYQFLQSGS